MAVIVVTMGSGGSDALEVGVPTVTGDALPDFDNVNNDTALGLVIPEVAGADFAGSPVGITRDGRAKVLMFFSHWCGVCQQEVPLIMDWLPGATLPEGVDLISVSTGVSSSRPNYPPSEWLEREGWTIPVILDDESNSVGKAFGLSAYPYFVFVNAEGRVVLRLTGGLPTATIQSIITELVRA
ncbi:MAG: TlpA disulfide reductase family protein [Actinomycetota bacterium]